ncbi:hypothetical protein BJ170DRAFT_54149 [Xylariales sp. AK1849]|nr:hypothetical protein BJ170DRAFT_54149 [Xylariales sp. AK1849]
MAPELRAKKHSATSQKPATKSKVVAPKRKAADDASPVTAKKAKSTKLDVTSKKASKAQKATEQTKADDEDPTSDEEDDQALALARVEESDEDDVEVHESLAFKEGQDVGKAPKASKAVRNAAEVGQTEASGVVYVGRIPHGFYEHEMRQYFSQFGDITKLRLSRNKKTGASKHYAFLEFAEESTAEIVSKTMNNYLLFGHLLKCRVIPKSQVHENLFKNANKRFKKIPHTKIAGNNLKKPLSEDKWAARISKTNQKRADQAKKLKEIGYEFEAPELKAAVAPKEVDEPAGEEQEAPKAIEAPPTLVEDATETPEAAEAQADDGVESLDGDRAVGKHALHKPAKANKQNGAKAGKKAKKPPKSKKAKA